MRFEPRAAKLHSRGFLFREPVINHRDVDGADKFTARQLIQSQTTHSNFAFVPLSGVGFATRHENKMNIQSYFKKVMSTSRALFINENSFSCEHEIYDFSSFALKKNLV